MNPVCLFVYLFKKGQCTLMNIKTMSKCKWASSVKVNQTGIMLQVTHKRTHTNHTQMTNGSFLWVILEVS